jgi:cardiolipin synthase A/B
MNVPAYIPARRLDDGSLLDQALTRASGTPLIAGNSVRLLKDAPQNYPAWLEAIRSAEHTIHFENYFIIEDDTGRQFAEALCDKARAGVTVRLIYDWLGSFGKASSRFWQNLRAAGVDVRCFNPPQLASPFGWLLRDHRKMLVIDGRVGFVTGLCVGDIWLGNESRGLDPWRDTGVEVRGPALRDVERAFEQVWNVIGTPLPADEISTPAAATHVGDVSLRIVANSPGTAAILRLDHIVAAAARRTLWITDAYFAGIPPYVQALRAAALDGVDVRLLVPGASDIPILRPLTQAGFRPLLEAGVRVFEWKGTMLHAKTAVADSRWARVGSSNLNVASWIGNYELDAVIENETFAIEMERMYEHDLLNCKEVVLRPKRRGNGLRVRAQDSEERRAQHRHVMGMSGRGGSTSRAAAGVLRIGRTVGAALTEQRVLASTEARIVAIAGIALVLLAAAFILWPYLIAVPLGVLFVWFGVALLAKARVLHRNRRAARAPEQKPA